MTLADQLAALEPLPPATVARLAGIAPETLRAKRVRSDVLTEAQLALAALALRGLAKEAERLSRDWLK